MDELTNFVEVDLAAEWLGSKRHHRRSPEDGLHYLEWASAITDNFHTEDYPTESPKPTLSQQALDAAEVKIIYLWWTAIRPNRPDPDEASKLNEFRRRMDIKYSKPEGHKGTFAVRSTWMSFYDNKQVLTESEETEYRALISQCSRIETEYGREDQEMLHRLIEIRGSLWT
jgi:hypothetical protein